MLYRYYLGFLKHLSDCSDKQDGLMVFSIRLRQDTIFAVHERLLTVIILNIRTIRLRKVPASILNCRRT